MRGDTPDDGGQTVGLIVNPIAGMGGAVGLKGTDGAETLAEAKVRGARPRAAARAFEALQLVATQHPNTRIVARAGMGAEEAIRCGFATVSLPGSATGSTTAADTMDTVRELISMKPDLLVFAGGDGTARDVLSVVGPELPTLGIPAGVKIHSGAFATSPQAGGRLIAQYLASPAPRTRHGEVLDVDEDAYRAGIVAPRFHGYLLVPDEVQLMQSPKVRVQSEEGSAVSIVGAIRERMAPGVCWLFGPGSTTARVLAGLGLSATLLGVDAVRDGSVIGADLGERAILEHVDSGPAKIVVSPIGGQGHVFGRGNQQLSAAVIRAVGQDNVVIVATPQKLATLAGRPLLVDTDDIELNGWLCGFSRVVTGHHEEVPYRVAAA